MSSHAFTPLEILICAAGAVVVLGASRDMIRNGTPRILAYGLPGATVLVPLAVFWGA
ncbi:MAG: hypothetical protein AAFQ84_10270 [Pseudomonadota bacterium]